jgi:hypothetical protein
MYLVRTCLFSWFFGREKGGGFSRVFVLRKFRVTSVTSVIALTPLYKFGYKRVTFNVTTMGFTGSLTNG